VLDHTPISGVAAVLGISWDTAHMAVTDVGTQLLIDHPGRLDGVEVVGVDEHAWRHTRKGDKYVTVIRDPGRHRPRPAALVARRRLKTSGGSDRSFRARVATNASFKTAAASRPRRHRRDGPLPRGRC
jgi:hypothetical protein